MPWEEGWWQPRWWILAVQAEQRHLCMVYSLQLRIPLCWGQVFCALEPTQNASLEGKTRSKHHRQPCLGVFLPPQPRLDFWNRAMEVEINLYSSSRCHVIRSLTTFNFKTLLRYYLLTEAFLDWGAENHRQFFLSPLTLCPLSLLDFPS